MAPFMNTRPLRLSVATGTLRVLARARRSEPLPGWPCGVVGGPQELGDLVDDGDDLALVPDVVAGGHAVDAHGQELVADLPGDPEAAGGVLDVGDAVVDVVLAEDDGQRLLHDGAPGAADDVADDQDVHARPSR